MNKATITALDQKSDVGSLCYNVEAATSPFQKIPSNNIEKKRKKNDARALAVSSHLQLQSSIPDYLPFEIPIGTRAGTKMTVQWPNQNGSRYIITCPEAIDQSCSHQILVVAPGRDRPIFSLPKPAKSKSKKRTWSRVGSEYQANVLPSRTVCMNANNKKFSAQ